MRVAVFHGGNINWDGSIYQEEEQHARVEQHMDDDELEETQNARNTKSKKPRGRPPKGCEWVNGQWVSKKPRGRPPKGCEWVDGQWIPMPRKMVHE